MKAARFTMNGKLVSMEEAYDEIRKLIPNGGTQFVDNLMANARENNLDSIQLTVGTKGTLKIDF